MNTKKAIDYIKSHGWNAWEVNGKVVAESPIGSRAGVWVTEVVVLDSAQDIRDWLGY